MRNSFCKGNLLVVKGKACFFSFHDKVSCTSMLRTLKIFWLLRACLLSERVNMKWLNCIIASVFQLSAAPFSLWNNWQAAGGIVLLRLGYEHYIRFNSCHVKIICVSLIFVVWWQGLVLRIQEAPCWGSSHMSDFVTIRPVQAEFRVDGLMDRQTDRHDEASSHVSTILRMHLRINALRRWC
jgi:hypothetical protein